jgi:hypothetical protein
VFGVIIKGSNKTTAERVDFIGAFLIYECELLKAETSDFSAIF